MSDLPAVHRPFSEARQQHAADLFGMYIFLATEVMLFGGFLVAVYVVRVIHPQEASSAAQHLKLGLGTINTAVLLTSSLFMALAVQAARQGNRSWAMRGLCITAGFGILFLCIKAYEYYEEYRDHLMPFSGSPSPFSRPGEQLFFNFYLAGTSLHALHLTIGIALVAGLVLRIAWVRPYLPERAVTVEVMGLYWHLVDVVWVFIYPVFYLAR